MISQLAQHISASATVALDTKAKQLKASGKPVISFGIGQPDFPTPDNVKQAAIVALGQNLTGYTPTLGVPELREAIAAKLKRENGLDYSKANIAVGSGAKGVLYELFLALLDPGDEVLILKPYWVSYTEQIAMAGGRSVLVGCDPYTFAPDLAELETRITPRSKLIVVNSPNNPSGVVYSRSQLEEIAQIAKQHKLLIISDEVYEHFYYSGDNRSIASLGEDAFARTIVVNAVSKTYSMTGWRLGYCAVPDSEIVGALDRLQGNNQGNPTSIAQYAAAAALTGEQSSVTVMRDAFLRRRDLMLSYFGKIPQFECLPPPGAFYCFPRVMMEGCDSMQLAEQILEETFVAVVPGKPFGMEGYLRFSYATPEDKIREGMERVVKWFKDK